MATSSGAVASAAACSDPDTSKVDAANAQSGKNAILTIEKQGSFSVGGTVIEVPGTYESQNFDNWKPYPEGQTYHGDHASVFYQIPQNARDLSMVFLHGAGQSARTWQTTPDGRDGFQNIFLKRGFGTYLIDQPRRGQAGRSTVEAQITPVADEQMWFEVWRMGHWPKYSENVQFPQDEASLEQFFQWMTPNTGNFDANLVAGATAKVFDKSGAGILVTHSQGGLPGWMAATQTDKIAAVAAYEPGNYLFPENEVPEALPSRTGALQGIGVPMDEFKKLTGIPIVIYFGDYIPEVNEVSDDLGAENWRVRQELGRKFVETVNKYGGDATLVELPKIGVHGNTHFLFAELNNVELANLLSDWMKEKGLDKSK
ncbi:alpha/beta fold hydrolase [Paenibacillus thalictri]|uniref:Alpha/beta fold hydrolase n=2 Tax=Paenibacillus thalictri TaxID=2527873 RepID=A0A4Q9DFZ0_9BACL|nr:alpha/beta fold hydrolase [Paenibacillus thalictri]